MKASRALEVVWSTLKLLRSLSSTVEDIDFRDCDLDGEKAVAFLELMARFISLKKVSFAGNTKLSVEGWRSLLRAGRQFSDPAN